MATLAKTVIATGASSGIGLEAIKQLLEQAQSYKIILGARNTSRTQAALDGIQFDRAANSVTVLPLDLSDIKGVKPFVHETLAKLGQGKIDYLFLNAGISEGAEKPGPHGSKWCQSYIVNHLSQHYLLHLLREKLVESQSRIVFTSSGAIRNVPDTSVLESNLKGASGAPMSAIYPQSKFVQLLGAHWWRRQLAGTNRVVAVSPGLIPETSLAKGLGLKVDMTDAKSVPEGALSVLRAFTGSDFPEDPERIFLTSWGEWWEKSVYENSLDKDLQDKWSPGKEEIERDEGISS